MLHRRIKIQLAIFAVVALVGGLVMVFGYMKAPGNFFGLGRYKVTVELPPPGTVQDRKCELPRHQRRPGTRGTSDTDRRGGGALADFWHRYPVGPDCRGAQRFGHRGAVRRVAAEQR